LDNFSTNKKKLWKKRQIFWGKIPARKKRDRERKREGEIEGLVEGKEIKERMTNHVRVVTREAFVVAAMPTNRQNPNGMQIAYDDDEWNWRG